MTNKTAAPQARAHVRNFKGPADDRLAIRDLIDSYSDAITRRDKDLWASCWATNARWKPLTDTIHGREQITDFWTSILTEGHGIKGVHNRLFLASPGSIVVNGDEGTGWCYTTELLVDEKHMTFHLNGMYSDRYVREDGYWVFLERVFRKLHIDRPY